MELFVRNRVAKAYWNAGKYIDEHLLEHKERADYATGFYERLSQDVDRDVSTLQRAVQFYRAYPNSVPGRNLTWGHYRRLITVKDPIERKKLEERILNKKWDTHKVQKYLNTKRDLAAAQKDTPISQLKFTPGKLHIYRVVPANKVFIQYGPLALDLGFREQYQIPNGAPKLKENDIVELAFSDSGEVSGARKVEAAQEELFTYKAAVERVIDGDTLLVSFDFGLPVSVSWKLRLRGIDCPELETEEGKKARRFVEVRLKACVWITVKTYKDRADKFDRYVADVFYESSVSDDLIYLNQELLNERLAFPYPAQ